MSHGTILRAARESAGLSIDRAAELIGVSRVTITDWEAERAMPTRKHWPAIREHLGVSLALTSVEQPIAAYGVDDSKYAFIARYNVAASAGPGADNMHEEVDGRHAYRKEWLEKRNLVPAACRVIDAVGDSMEPTIFDGDTVLVNTASRKLISGKVFAFRTDEGVRLKRLHKQMDGRVRVSSDNPDKLTYPDEWLTPGMEAEIIGEVVHRSGAV
ncbi:MAG: S24 family peptidase [Burkholderiales bacterium]|jgi:phage repressor protein C with HTH and peptisase S24 domain